MLTLPHLASSVVCLFSSLRSNSGIGALWGRIPYCLNLGRSAIRIPTGTDTLAFNGEKSMTTEEESIVIYAYTRKQAMADGVLVDVSKMAGEAGFRYHVAMTAAVFHDYVEVPEGVEGQDSNGRLWDILNLLRFHIKGSKNDSTLMFKVLVNNGHGMKRVTLKSVCSPDDDGHPCITIMLPNED